jgi:hypothetical protein
MTTTNTNKNYMSGSSVDDKVDEVNYGCTRGIDYRKENGCTRDYENFHLALLVNQRLYLADLEGFTNIEETERSYIRNALNLGSFLTDWEDYFSYHTIAIGIDVVQEKINEIPRDEMAKHTISANFHLNKQYAIDLKLYQETANPKTRYLLGLFFYSKRLWPLIFSNRLKSYVNCSNIDLYQKGIRINGHYGHENEHYGKEQGCDW